MSAPAPATALGLGAAMPSREFGPVTITDVVRFAGAGGDFNPLHHDPAAAEAAGFGGIIAMGQFQAALLAGALSDWVGVESVAAYRIRFASPLRVGETLTLEGEVTAVDDDAATLELRARVGERAVITGSATVRTRTDATKQGGAG